MITSVNLQCVFPFLHSSLTFPFVCFVCLCSQYFRETVLNEIRKARELYTGAELAAELRRIQQRLDNVECLSADVVINLLLSYRDIQVTASHTLLVVLHSDGKIFEILFITILF